VTLLYRVNTWAHGWPNGPMVRMHQRLDQRGGAIFENVHGLAAGLAVDIRECRRGLYVSRAA